MDLLLYLCATLSLLALFTIGLTPTGPNGRTLPKATYLRVFIFTLLASLIFVVAVSGGYFLWLLSVLAVATIIIAIRRACGEDTYYERPFFIFIFTVITYLGPTLLYIGILWLTAPKLSPEQSINLIESFPKVFAKRIGRDSFVKILESKASIGEFENLKKIYDSSYSADAELSLIKVLDSRNSACQIVEVLKNWDLGKIDKKTKIFLLQLAKSHNLECDLFKYLQNIKIEE